MPKWQEPEWEMAKRIASLRRRFVRLPTNFDIHEWAIMRDFSDSVAPGRIRAELVDAIHGAGAFRSFKSALRRHRIEETWFKFREQAIEEIARAWCKEDHIPVE